MVQLMKTLVGNLYQSETMQYTRITMQREVVQPVVEQLGTLSIMEFTDLSHHLNAFQRQFAADVKRCEEVERKTRYFTEQLFKSKISFQNVKSPASIYMDDEDPKKPVIDSLEQTLEETEKELREHNERLDQMKQMKNKSEELFHVLAKAGDLINFGEADTQSSSSLEFGDDGRGSSGLGYVAGVLPTSKISVFNLLIYRATRGNVVPRYVNLTTNLYDSRAGAEIPKSVFVVFFGANAARDKVKKICDSIGASIHELPEGDQIEARQQVEATIQQYQSTIDVTEKRREELLHNIATNLERWKQWIAIQKAVYNTMNLFEYKRNLCYAEGWIPENKFEILERTISDADLAMNVQTKSLVERIAPSGTPPTHFEVNQFTDTFQNIVNAYGIPQYKEANPAPFTIITFPFLFAVMFGDYGHGTILLCFSLFLILGSKKIAPAAEASELVGMIYGGRWVLFLMSVFSIFTGLLYNDWFGLSFNIFGTAYVFDEKTEIGTKVGSTYVFGVDPAWYGTLNKLMFNNSLKMKMSIVFGVIQMMVGIVLAGLNMIQFKHYEDLLFEFIPEVIILGGTFGYMSFIIIYKWCIYYPTYKYEPASLLNTMTDFFLHPWGLQQPPVFDGQLTVQLVCLISVVVMCPILLLPKPFYEWIHHKLTHRKHGNNVYASMEEEATGSTQPINAGISHNPSEEIHEETIEEHKKDDVPTKEHIEEVEEFNFTEVFIRQMIHTIEFVLGTVSNTASYLRLWALSLAHNQLSEVFWDMTMKFAFTFDVPSVPVVRTIVVSTGIGVFVAFTIWICATVGVLCGMESLSAFLHSLRLHWVEFQNKFYKGDGHLFTPFSADTVMMNLRAEDRSLMDAMSSTQ